MISLHKLILLSAKKFLLFIGRTDIFEKNIYKIKKNSNIPIVIKPYDLK